MKLHSPRRCPHCGSRTITPERVLKAVEKRPRTTNQIAERLRAAPEDISTRLSKLAGLGLINREYRSGLHNGGGYRYAVWSAKAEEMERAL